MPFIPHTAADERQMLDALGVASMDALFDEIPPALLAGELTRLPPALGEMQLLRLMGERAEQDRMRLCFLGAGAYEHHIPAAVWELASRGEFMTAYTPYQAEASQGTLQTIYEFQTMMTRLLAMPVANASVYDGASALAEAALMALRANRKNPSLRVAVAGNTHPAYAQATAAIVAGQGVELELLPFDEATGLVSEAALERQGELGALVISYPSFFGGLQDVHRLTDWAHAREALVIAVVNPVAMAVLTPPGHWGARGADIALGEGQPLGIPLSSGGPYLGFMACRKEIVRQMPGRLVGGTEDLDGRPGYVLTLQAREQHIRRGKATSNICTNQGLLVTAATIYLSLLGDQGLRAVAMRSANGLDRLVEKACRLEGVGERFAAPRFHETVLRLPQPAAPVLRRMAEAGIIGGLALGDYYRQIGAPGGQQHGTQDGQQLGTLGGQQLGAQGWQDLDNCLLVNVTETKTEADLDLYVATLEKALAG